MPLPLIGVLEALCFQVIHPYVRPVVRACILLARYLRTQWREFHQTLVDDVVEVKDKLVRF